MALPDVGRPSPAERRSATNTYWGESVEDPYQHLEDTKDAEQLRWSKEQSERAAKYLGGLPARAHFRRELERIVCFQAPTFFDVRLRREGGDQIFFSQKRLPPNPQPLLVTFKQVEGDRIEDRVLFNPAEAEGVPAMDWMQPSPDGTLVALSLSLGGTERGDVRVLRTETGEFLENEVAKRANSPTAGGSLAWVGERGFYYTRHPLEGEVGAEDMDFFQKIYYHELGTTSDKDLFCLGRTFPRIAECQLLMAPGGGHVVCACADGDGGDYAIYVSAGGEHPHQEGAGGWRYISGFKDNAKDTVKLSPNGARLYALSRDGAPMGKIVCFDTAELAGCSADLEAAPNLQLLRVVVAESPKAAIEDFIVTKIRLYVSCLIGGPSQVLIFDAETGSPLQAFPTPEAHVVFGLIPLPESSEGGDDIYFASMGYTAPRALQRYCAATGKVSRTALVQESPVDMSDVEAVAVFSTSKDGTQVPMTIVRKKGGGTSPCPCVLYAYGGYGISMVPAFRASLKVWLDLGGIYVVANIRGGAEYGEHWHLNGNLTKKQNCFDDFIACAQQLVSGGHTSRELLAIQGGSNGGLLMGAVMTQRPELFRAVVAQVGIFDCLRTELEPNGVFNIPEFGTVKDEAQYRALRAYSPYHNLPAPGVPLPSLLLTTGENDGRVASWQSKKFAAALQPLFAALPAERPLVLRVSYDTGHGMGTPLLKHD
mmetsp:Transcript_9747/g.18826  ORF Transcript_9747/g.18826 Transcript_9747/m.18826 type:complete len:709 (+) Transcript_9747:86-2212(+)